MLKDLHAVEAMRGIYRYPGKVDNRIYRLRTYYTIYIGSYACIDLYCLGDH